jgi:hypothetical protein
MATVIEATARHAGREGTWSKIWRSTAASCSRDGEDDAQAAIPYPRFKAKGFSPSWNQPRYAFA